MPLTLVTGPANAAKARVVLDAYRAASAAGALLVVPTGADVEHYRRELVAGGAVFGVRVLRLEALVDEMARRAGVRGRPAGPVLRERLVAAAIAQTPLRWLAPSAGTPGFASALLALVDELEEARIEPGRWHRALRDWAAGDPGREVRAQELGGLYGSYRRLLERVGAQDPALHVRAVLDALALDPGRWGATPVFLYGFDDLAPLQRDVVETLALAAGAQVTVSLPFEAGRAAFADRARTYAELRALGAQEITCPPVADYYAPGARTQLHRLERALFEPAGKSPSEGEDGPAPGPGAAEPAVRTLEGGGERAEAELVAAHAAHLLRVEGIPAEEIAIVHRGISEAAPLLERVLRDYGVPVAIDRRMAAGHTALGRGLGALLACAVPGAPAADLMVWLRTPGVAADRDRVDRLEVECRREGIRTAARARALWERGRPAAEEASALAPVDRIAALLAPAGRPLCEALAAEVQVLLAGSHRRAARVLAGAEAADAAVAARLLEALEELAELPPPLAPAAAEIGDQLARLEVQLGDPPGPGRVTVCGPLALRARRVRALFCMGLQEGVFPRPARPEPFLGEEDRREINMASGLRLALPDDAGAAERYLFYATVSRPTDRLHLSWHAATDDGAPVVRSPLVDDVADVLGAGAILAPLRRELGAAGWEGPLSPTGREAARAAAAKATPGPIVPIGPLPEGAVRGALAQRPTWSASAIESWIACPVRWFVERLLRPGALEPDPEQLVRGQLAHEVLEHAFRELSADGAIGPGHLPEARALIAAELRERGKVLKISAYPERLRAALRRLEVELVRYVERAAHTGSAFVPSQFEVRFGAAEDPLPPLELAGGAVRLEGKIDRIDVGPGSSRRPEMIVYDYKGATATPAAQWLSKGKLQIPLYMLAVRDVLGGEPAGGLLQPLRGRDPRPRGAVRADADPGLDVVRNDRLKPEDLDALLEEAEEVAVATVREMRAGALVPRPDSCGFAGTTCSFPAICRCAVAG